MAPAVVLLAAVALYPVLAGAWMSLERIVLVFHERRFVGLDNFRELAVDERFRAALGRTIYFTVVAVAAELALALPLALLLDRTVRGRGLLRALVLVPWAIPTAVSAKLWAWMLEPGFGLFSRLWPGPAVNWLGDPAAALHVSILLDVWKTTPFVALLVLAGLQTVPVELHEAAQVDGAGRWERFRRVTLPLILPTLLVAMLFRTMDAIRVFDVIYVMTLGSVGTESMATYCRRLLVDFQDLGYGSACSVAIFLLVGSVSAVYAVLLARRERAR